MAAKPDKAAYIARLIGDLPNLDGPELGLGGNDIAAKAQGEVWRRYPFARFN